MKVNVGCTRLTMSELARICGGMLCCVGGETNKDTHFTYICTDSRESSEGALFVALDGERVDGHDYIGAALSSGGDCVLCERIPEALTEAGHNYVAVVVDDSVKALGELAKAYDRRTNHRKVAITGSVGKTTTKEFVASVLAEGFKVHKTEGNYNSNIGMPLSMLSMSDGTEVSVLEMGMSDFGEIEYLSRIAEPDIAIVTNIGSSHMEHLGSRANICRAKMEIVKGLKTGGTLLLNGDEPLLRSYPTPGVRPIFVGIETDCDFRAVNIRYNVKETVFDIEYNGTVLKNVRTTTMGRHNVYAALYAFAVGVRMNLDIDTILRGLANYKPVGMRQNIYDIGDITVIEDCYNASPESMRAAMSVLADLKRGLGTGRMTALLGDMYELGASSEMLHEEVGREFSRLGGDILFTFGQNAEGIGDGAVFGGMDIEKIFRNPAKNVELSGEMIIHSLRKGDILLVKASRGAAAERVLNYLKANSDRLCSRE